ncbi:MAG: thiamine pyrophosphate-binding protein [Candidatus Rokubacteria bacterium]|nr:thiamine pyrophosphate-binding protein [Candidatus Rokubacteria bacterium]
MTTRTGGEWVVEALRAEGVRHVFGIPGVHNLAVYDALLRQRDIVHVLARHESGAAFMADGYARACGEPGVVVVTTGPGATNTLTPLAESYSGSVPVLCLMSDIASDLVGRDLGALHEVPNQIACFRPVTRWAELVADGRSIATSIAGAFDLLRTGRPGPVALSIPNDLLFGTSEGVVRSERAGRRPPCHVNEIAEAARRLAAAARPLIVAGGGVVSAGASAELLEVARRLGAPVITTVMGRGAISEADPLWHAVLPNKRATEEVFRDADVVLAAGCRFAARSTKGLLLNLAFAPHQTLIHMDLDATVIGRMFKPQLGIVGDAKNGLGGLAAVLDAGAPNSRWNRERLAALKTAASERYTPEVDGLLQALRSALPPDGILVNDQTGINYWAEWRYPVLAPRTFLYPVGSAVLGYAVPAAIGAQIARPGTPVVAVVGDGGFMFSVNELATAVKYRLPIAFLVMNDDRYGAIKWLQEQMFEGRWGEADLANPDFIALARAFGARGERVAAVAALPDALRAAFAADGPTVLELRMEVEPPWEM